MKINTIQLYEDREDVTLTTYILSDSAELLKGKKRPAVMVCPGGGYLGCSDREAEPVALRFASMGYHAFVLRYSTYNNGVLKFDLSERDKKVNPKSVYPAPMRDIGKAFLLIRQYADEWLLDVDKIAICGFSAGAHNCAMYSVYWQDPIIYEFFAEEAALFKPAATIMGYGISDYHQMMGEYADPVAKAMSTAATFAFLGTETPSEEMLNAISPALHIGKNTPPMFLWATAADALVPVENTTCMATALAQAGIPFEVHIFEQGPHGLSLADQASAGSQFEINLDVEKWIDLVRAWLKKRFALDLPQKPAWLMEQESIENRNRKRD